MIINISSLTASLMEIVARMFHPRGSTEVNDRLRAVEEQSHELRGHLESLSKQDNPFEELVRSMKQSSVRRRRDRDGHAV
jgi:hypothetical protein